MAKPPAKPKPTPTPKPAPKPVPQRDGLAKYAAGIKAI